MDTTSVESVIAWLEDRVRKNKAAQGEARKTSGMRSHTYSRMTHYWHESQAILTELRTEHAANKERWRTD